MEGEAIKLLLKLDEEGIAISSGSACSANHAGQPSHVLQAMGFDPIKARGSLRITLGRFNTEAEVARFLDVLQQMVKTLRPISSQSGHDEHRREPNDGNVSKMTTRSELRPVRLQDVRGWPASAG